MIPNNLTTQVAIFPRGFAKDLCRRTSSVSCAVRDASSRLIMEYQI